MAEYLQNDQHYIDRYDIQTIEECLDWYQRIREKLEAKRASGEIKELSKEEFDKEVHKLASYWINILKAERYKHKAETLRHWKDMDSNVQVVYDRATPPLGVVCKKCSSQTKVISKDLHDAYTDSAFVLFVFECVKCEERQARRQDGTEWKRMPSKCPECSTPLKEKSKATKHLLTTLYSCPRCSYTKKDVHDFRVLKKKQEARAAKEAQLFADYREQLCLDDVKGPELIRSYEGLAQLAKEMEEKREKETNPVYQRVQQLKRLTLVQLEKVLEPHLGEKDFKDLRLGKPEMAKYVTVDFSVNDAKDGRQEYESQNTLKKLIKVCLEDTNWRLMSEGIQYRLGILTGRLKAYEREEDLVELVK